jgi:hypothetical protein
VGNGLVISKDLAYAFQKHVVGSGGKVQSYPGEKTDELFVVDVGLRCTSFD